MLSYVFISKITSEFSMDSRIKMQQEQKTNIIYLSYVENFAENKIYMNSIINDISKKIVQLNSPSSLTAEERKGFWLKL